MNISQISDIISKNLNIILFYLPLGIIGIWRWGVWIIRKSISIFYRTPKGDYKTTLSIITPVYNEDPDVFRGVLASWSKNSPDEIIAVIDHTDKENIEIFKKFQESHNEAKIIVTKIPGKRPALADGIKASTSEIVALVDSDTLWSPDIKDKLTGPFSDPKVGGLVTRQDVVKTDTLARTLFKILLDDRYLLEYPFLSTVSDALLCLSGRTAVYRRIAISDKLDRLVTDKFWGTPMISGDDKTLTRLIHEAGWKSRYLRDVRVYTTGAAKMRDFMKQKLRWTRNGLRSDSKVLFSSWVWKRHKMLALHMIDKFISPMTLLIAPVYFTVALYFKHWEIALMIFGWWIISRAIKIYPHLREQPMDVFILPTYVLMTFVAAVVKLYAMITIDEQGWITRWDKDRLVPLHFFKRAMAYLATGSLIFVLFFIIFSYKNSQLIAAQQKKEMKITSMNIFTPENPRPSDQDLADTRERLLTSAQNDPFGYYVVKPGDTISILRRRFNLPATARILDAKTKIAISNFAFLQTGQQIAISIDDLRIPISSDVLRPNLFSKPPRVTYDQSTNTIFVAQGGSVATLKKISLGLPLANRKLLEETAPGVWILRANLYVGKSVTLVLDGTEVKTLRLKSDENGFIWLRSESGSMLISNTSITSWDEKKNGPDVNYDDGRAYITAKNSGRMDIINSDLGYLGYVGYPRRGGPFGGSYGVSWKIKSHGFRESLLTGVVLNSKFHNNYFGFYTFGVTGMLVRGNQAYDNIQYGFDPHDDSNNMLIENNLAYNNGNHGIIISKRCFNNVISKNTSHDNRLHGIMIDRDSNNNLVQGNTVYGNVDGIAIYGSNDNIVLENDIHNNIRGIRTNAGASRNYFEKNEIRSNSRGIYLYDRAQGNILFSNIAAGNDIGITIKNDSNNNQLLDNMKTTDNKRDGRITADSYGNNIQ